MPTGIYKRKPFTEEHRKNLGLALKKSPIFQEHIKKLHQRYGFKKGHIVSEEMRRKIGLANKDNLSRVSYNKGKYGKNTSHWKGGKFKALGYVYILKPKHPFATKTGYVREHRLIIEQQIKRYLLPQERGHHVNGVKDDNRLQNLMAFVNRSAHQRFHRNPDNVKPEEIIFNGQPSVN